MTPDPRNGPLRRGIVTSLMVVALAASAQGAGLSRPCFDFDTPVVEPLHPPIAMVPGRDNNVFGTYPSGVSWAATRARVTMPITALYAKVLDHRNHKDMTKTVLTTTDLPRPGYLHFQRVDVVVTVRALLFNVKLPWTEEWAFSLLEGTPEAPRRILASYQLADARTRHLKHQCGSYVLQALDAASADLSMYDEVIADHRSAEDTRNMQAGILSSIRGEEP